MTVIPNAMTSQDHFDQVARNGARLLDSQRPGWWSDISVEDLRLDGCTDCVLGQLFGDYMEGRVHLGMTGVESANYGFTIPVPFNREPYWAQLTRAWKREILRRQHAPLVGHDGRVAVSIPHGG